MAMKLHITYLEVFGDSKLVINQILALYEVNKSEIFSYLKYAKRILKWFADIGK